MSNSIVCLPPPLTIMRRCYGACERFYASSARLCNSIKMIDRKGIGEIKGESARAGMRNSIALLPFSFNIMSRGNATRDVSNFRIGLLLSANLKGC